ncbi:MAG: type II secretion system protein GspK [Verrucomicrobiota bacterium]
MTPAKGRPAAFILVAVLIIVMLSSMVVVSLLFRVRAEETATVAGAGSQQAWAAAMSGVQEAIRIAAGAAPGDLSWQEDVAAFRERLVVDEGSERWYFSVYGESGSDHDGLRFGLEDEGSKLNLNEATEEMLEKLPRMTPYLVQSLLDFVDSDDTPRPEGAEQEYYDTLVNPYNVFNHPLDSVEQLLLVRGFTPALLYGEDANWNYQLDANEDDAELQFPPDNKDGRLDLGLRPYLSVWSYDLDQANDGSPRIPLNDYSDATITNAISAGEEFPAPLVAYIEALRRNNLKLEHPADLLEAKTKFKGEGAKEETLESGVGKSELSLVLDRFTTSTTERQPGLVNINTASAVVLRTLPGIDEALADAIVAARRNLRAEQRRTTAWLYQEGLMDAVQFKKTSPYLTARSFQFHLQVVGYGLPSGRYRVLEAVIDVAGKQPAIAYLRDITRLGLPFAIEARHDGDTSEPSTTAAARRPRSFWLPHG